MTAKVNPDHVQKEITLRLGQDLPLIKISCKSMCNFLCEATHVITDKPPSFFYRLRHHISLLLTYLLTYLLTDLIA